MISSASTGTGCQAKGTYPGRIRLKIISFQTCSLEVIEILLRIYMMEIIVRHESNLKTSLRPVTVMGIYSSAPRPRRLIIVRFSRFTTVRVLSLSRMVVDIDGVFKPPSPTGLRVDLSSTGAGVIEITCLSIAEESSRWGRYWEANT